MNVSIFTSILFPTMARFSQNFNQFRRSSSWKITRSTLFSLFSARFYDDPFTTARGPRVYFLNSFASLSSSLLFFFLSSVSSSSSSNFALNLIMGSDFSQNSVFFFFGCHRHLSTLFCTVMSLSSFRTFYFKNVIVKYFIHVFFQVYRQSGQAIKLVVWEVNHIENTPYPF